MRYFPPTLPFLSARSLRRTLRRFLSIACGFALTLLGLTPCEASVNGNRVDITLQGTILESLTLAVANSAVAFGTLTPGATNAAPAGQALSITSTWILSAGENVKLYAYFDSASSALAGTAHGDSIPTSAVLASFNGAATQAFTQASPFTAGSTAASLYTVAITSSNAITAGRTDSLALSLNLTGISLHPDTYVGTMHIQAQAL